MISVYAPQEIRVQRVIQRDGLTEAEVLKRINRQMDEDMKMKRCHHVIINNEQELLIPQVLELHRKFSARRQ